MYHAIVRKKITHLFTELNAGNFEPILASFAPRHKHFFVGTHALSGTRQTLASTRRWYERLLRLLPDLTFELHAIDVRGWPWDTLAVIEWTETNSATDGVKTSARGAHVVSLKWGKMVRLAIYPDTAMLVATLKRIAAKGTEEALAGPIED